MSARSTFRNFIVPTLLMVTLQVSAIAQPAEQLTDKVSAFMKAAEEVYGFQGAVEIRMADKTIISEGYGMANVELAVPNQPQTKFLIGSITKQFTATAILQLSELGKLKIDDPITAYLPDYPMPTEDTITVFHLLTHSSGIPSYTDMEIFSRRALPMSLEEIIASFKDAPLQFKPGAKFSYSNSGYILLGAIIERLSGQSYEDFVRQHILEPAGMENSGYAHNEIILPLRAAGYFNNENGELRNADYIHMSVPHAAGALYSTVEDLILWDKTLYTNKLLSGASWSKMFTSFRDNYGFGWMIDTLYDRKRIWHNGGIDGFHSNIVRFLDDDACIVLLSNNIGSPVERMADQLAAIMFGRPYDLPVIKSPIEIDPSSLSEYTGVFQVGPEEFRIVSLEENRLYSQRTGGQQIRLFPEAEDKFFFEHDNSVTMQFERGDTNQITAHIMHQNGTDQRAQKVIGPKADSILASFQVIEVDRAILEKHVGEYQLMPGFNLSITLEDGRLFAQATGQGKNEIYPNSPTEFFLRVVDARITFEQDSEGNTTGLILHQGGRNMPAPRVK